MVHAYRLFTAEDGDSHVERGSFDAAALIKTETLQFRETPAHSSKHLHTAPVAQFIIMLTGVVEFRTRGSETFTTYPGDVLLVADTTGSGHAWKVIGEAAWTRACVVFSADEDAAFIRGLA
jgi:hypothetical protein